MQSFYAECGEIAENRRRATNYFTDKQVAGCSIHRPGEITLRSKLISPNAQTSFTQNEFSKPPKVTRINFGAIILIFQKQLVNECITMRNLRFILV